MEGNTHTHTHTHAHRRTQWGKSKMAILKGCREREVASRQSSRWVSREPDTWTQAQHAPLEAHTESGAKFREA